MVRAVEVAQAAAGGFDYESEYKRLRASGAPGWAGACQPASEARLASAIETLIRGGLIPLPPARALELGCGNGATSRRLAGIGYQVSGIDISATAADWARERRERDGVPGMFSIGDVRDMRAHFTDQSFDLVYDGACLHCLIDDDRRGCLQEVRRVLRRNGCFVVSSMCGTPRSFGDGLVHDATRAMLMRDGIPYRTILPLPLLLQELAVEGFNVVHRQVAENPWWDHATLVCRHATVSS